MAVIVHSIQVGFALNPEERMLMDKSQVDMRRDRVKAARDDAAQHLNNLLDEGYEVLHSANSMMSGYSLVDFVLYKPNTQAEDKPSYAQLEGFLVLIRDYNFGTVQDFEALARLFRRWATDALDPNAPLYEGDSDA